MEKDSSINNEDLEVYHNLRQHLDGLPIGYPSTESGVELKILKHLFTPLEAKIAVKLRITPEPLQKIYRRVKRMGISIEELEEILYRMYKKGSIAHATVVDENGETKYYANAFLAVGMYEYQLNRLSKEFVQDFEQYVKEAFMDEFTKTKINQLRTIPVRQSISSDHSISTYDDVRSILENKEITKGKIAIMDCVCRKSKDILGKSCKLSDLRETCMTIGRGAQISLDKGWSRPLTKEEALKLLDKFEEAGFVVQPDNTQVPFFICNCCGCCCELTTHLRKLDKPVEYISSNFYAEVDSTLCTGCEVCVSRCLMDAISLIEYKSWVNGDRCIGCGLCISTCPVEALTLKKKENETEPPVDRADLYTRIINKKAELARSQKN
ncbi:MAG: 4Fe-4S dicluster domain-containing protein [Promethearchaeota archaeon]|nr:MAG: 4Fe-4S dicluster domain-containing protein [Candidatus Lokiarchaeota archaeon]